MSWSRFIDSPAAEEHGVQVYGETAELAASVAAFFADGPAVAIVTREHWQAIERALPAHGADPAAVVVLDARDTLDAVLERGLDRAVGPVLDELAARDPGATIRALGEMVDLLWQDGDVERALLLERQWNALQETRPVALLCAYCADVLDVGVQQRLAPIFHVHTHARPVADPARLSAALDAALCETLGADDVARVYLDAADRVPPGELPRAQAVIGRLVEQDPATAAAVLGRVRVHYAG